MTRPRWYILGGLVLLLVVLQLVPSPPANNPPVEEELAVPDEVAQVLQRSCYDCHSNETAWPWYSHVAPMKLLVRRHVADARDEMNFTAWNRIDLDDRAHKFEEIVEEVDEEHMPLRSYLIVHRDARLTEAERELLMDWASAEEKRLQSGAGDAADAGHSPGPAGGGS